MIAMSYQRSVFKPDGVFVAVKPFPRAGHDIKVGDVVEARRNLLRLWYRLRRIGLKGDSWTNFQLARRRSAEPEPIEKSVRSDEPNSDGHKEGRVLDTRRKKANKKSAKED